MRRIFKYAISITDIQGIAMPQNSTIIHAGLDPKGLPCIWARVAEGSMKVSKTIYVVGTGNPINECEI